MCDLASETLLVYFDFYHRCVLCFNNRDDTIYGCPHREYKGRLFYGDGPFVLLMGYSRCLRNILYRIESGLYELVFVFSLHLAQECLVVPHPDEAVYTVVPLGVLGNGYHVDDIVAVRGLQEGLVAGLPVIGEYPLVHDTGVLSGIGIGAVDDLHRAAQDIVVVKVFHLLHIVLVVDLVVDLLGQGLGLGNGEAALVALGACHGIVGDVYHPDVPQGSLLPLP